MSFEAGKVQKRVTPEESMMTNPLSAREGDDKGESELEIISYQPKAPLDQGGSGSFGGSMNSTRSGLGAVSGVTISLHNVGVDVIKRGSCGFGARQSKTVLDGVTGCIEAGYMYGLMGPSGAGKTTLLDVVSHRLRSPAQRRGEVLYDGHRPTMSEVRRDASYVEQNDDVLSSMGHFTVFEMVLFAAMCKLPSEMSRGDKVRRVHDVLKQMSLSGCHNTVVGNPNVSLRGVSGGERKRVAISMGLLYNPRVIFLDEPTTGLDSFMAAEVMTIVKAQLQGRGCTLVVTIHQPSPAIYELLDRLILLKAGRVIYFGDGRMAPCDEFARLGFPYRQGYNVAEHLLETLTDKGGKCDFSAAYEASEQCQAQTAQADAIWNDFGHNAGTPAGQVIHQRRMSFTLAMDGEAKSLVFYANSPLKEIWILLKYRVAVKWRMMWFVASKLCIPIFVGAVYASFFNSLPKNFWGAFTTAGLLFVTVTMAGFLAIAPLEDFKGEWPLVLRQRQDAYYRSSSYVAEKIFQELPYGVLGALGFALVTYFIIGLKMTPYAFFFYTFTSFVVNMVATSISFAAASNITIEFLPQTLVTVYNTLNVLVAGFFLPQCQIPKWWSWLYWISYQQWSWAALMINQFGETSGVEKAVQSGECESSFDSGSKCSGGVGDLMNRLPLLFGSVLGNGESDGNRCTAMNDFTLGMFNLGPGFKSHESQWMCLLWASLSLPFFMALFFFGVWRTTRSTASNNNAAR